MTSIQGIKSHCYAIWSMITEQSKVSLELFHALCHAHLQY